MRKSPINIIGGFYKDPNLHWSRQDTLNWIPVAAEQGGTLTQYQLRDAPGVKPFVRITRDVEVPGDPPTIAVIDVGPVRGMRNVEDKLFVVAAQTVYQISNTGVAIPVGTIPGVGRVSMAHNQFGLSNQLIIVNGSAGYIVDTSLLTVTKITDEGYPGAFVADYIDQYLAQVEPQGRYWFHSDLAQGLHYNTLDRYEAEADPDRIVSLLVSHREVLIFGKDTIEPFVNTGGQTGTFERASNTVIEVGCAAKFTPRKLDNSVFWLDDKRLVRRLDGYTPIRISTDAIDAAFSECSESEVAQAYAFTWETRGHKVYYITVPGRFTFGYDVLTRQWHRRSTWNLPHWDVIDAAFWNGKWIVASGRYGRLYELDQDYKLDSCDPLVRKRVTGKLWDSENDLTLNNVELKFNTGGKESVCVLFPDQPEGPAITGSAPDGFTGDPYSFPYTITPGDAPIARTVLMPGSYVMVGETQYTIPGQGWSWNQNTATISNSTIPLGVATVNLVLRTYDTNGLFADHTDTFNVVQLQYLLVTGVAKGSGQPIFAYAQALEPLEFTGIPQASGADLASSSAAWDGEKWCAVSSLGSRTSDALSGPWVTGTLTPANSIRPVVGLADGWVAVRQEELTSSVYTSPTDGSAFILPGVTSTLSNGDPGDASSSSILFELEDQYYLCRGATNRAVYRSTDRDGPYVALWDIYKEIAAGRDPNGAHISYWYDIKKFGEEYFAIIGWHFDDAFQRFKIIKSPSLTNWDSFDVVVDVARDDGANRPAQLCAGDTAIVAYTTQGKIWTSANNWEEPIDTGLVQTAGSNFNAVALFGGKRIVQGSNLFYMIGNEDKVVVFNPATLAVSAPVTMPIDDAVSISISSVEAP